VNGDDAMPIHLSPITIQWAQIKSDDLPKVSALIKQLDLPALVISGKTEAK